MSFQSMPVSATSSSTSARRERDGMDLLASPTEILESSSASSLSSSSSSSDEENENGEQALGYGALPIPNPTQFTSGPNAGLPIPPATRYISKLRNDYRARLATFPSTWPHGQPDVAECAKNGFFFTGFGLRIKCAYCGVNLDRQNAYTQIVPQHYAISPRCPVLNLTYQLNFDTMIGAVYRSLGIGPEDIPSADQFRNAVGVNNAPDAARAAENVRRAIRRVRAFGRPNGIAPAPAGEPVVSTLWNLNPRTRARAFGPMRRYPTSSSVNRVGETAENNEQLDEQQQQEQDGTPDMSCKVCLEKTCRVVFYPCRHLVTCRDCAKKLVNCCICRQQIKAACAVFF